MKGIRPKRPRLRLDPEPYEQLRKRVLRRDGWKCQYCGSRTNLEVHHQDFRSQSGDDSDKNLITLYVGVPLASHGGKKRNAT